MHSPFKVIKVSVLSLTMYMVLSTVAFSIEREIYDNPDQQSGKTIHGTVVKVVERDAAAHTWDVSVEDGVTGDVVPLHLDKMTDRLVTNVGPAVGDKVVVTYDEHSKHALSFVLVAAINN